MPTENITYQQRAAFQIKRDFIMVRHSALHDRLRQFIGFSLYDLQLRDNFGLGLTVMYDAGI